MSVLRKCRQIFPISRSLGKITIYKTFIRSQLDYGNMIYDQAYNSAFNDKIESVQYNACFAITGAIRDTSTKKYTKNQAQNLLNPSVGLKNFVIFIRCSMKTNPRIYLI